MLSILATTMAVAQTPSISNVQVTNLTSTSATVTFSTGTAVFAGISYAPSGGAWSTINEAYAVNHSVALTGLTPGTQYSYVPWYSGGSGQPSYTFTTPGGGPSISNVQVTNLTSTSATVTFSTGTAVFAGISYAPSGGTWSTINEAYAVNHSVALSGLTPGTQYSYVPWYSGGSGQPSYTFTTPGGGPSISNVQVTNLTSTSATVTFSTGTAVFAGISYAPSGGTWSTINEAYAVNHSVALTGLTPGTQYSYVPWYSGGSGQPSYTFTTPGGGPSISNVQVTNLTSTSATISFSTGTAALAGISYGTSGGAPVSVNDTIAVTHIITLNNLLPNTQYNYSLWATGASSYPTQSFTTPAAAPSNSGTTNIDVGGAVIRTGMNRIGMNIEGQNFYDSGQMLKNLVFRNPGFEAETWQSILHCAAVAANSCTDGNVWTQWPANFLQGATFQFIHGAAQGQTGSVLTSTAASSSGNIGVTVTFSPMTTQPAAGDFVVVSKTIPGNAQAGWWTTTSGGASLSTDFTDLSPETPGKQALELNASGSGQIAQIDGYFDTTDTHNFVLLDGTYTIAFRAKAVSGNQMTVSLARQVAGGSYFKQTIPLTNTWQDYSFTFSAAETSSTPIGSMDLRFMVSGANVYVDDVSLTPVETGTNATAFRDAVVSALTALQPGTLRYMDDGGPAFGSSIDNMIAVPFARQRSGSSEAISEEDDVPLGLNEFLQLCQAVGAQPWYVLPPAISPGDMQNLIEFLAGGPSTTYGAKRAALGQSAPWTSVFPVVHLELGNEQWNNPTFPGQSINDPIAYGNRVSTIYGAARSAPDYNPASFDLIMGSFVVNSWYTGQETANATNYDSISVAPYMFGSFNDASSTEAIYGPMFAEPEMSDSTSGGNMYQQAQAAASAGKSLVSYEENLATQGGTAPQSMVSAVVPSVGGGVMMADHMLLQMRDLGVKVQNVWALPGYSNAFNNPNGGSETTPLFGTVVDMGGQSNLQRPVFLAEQLVNQAILPTMIATTVTGANPTWNQPLSTNDNVQLNGAHQLQSFAFTDGANHRSVVLVNLSRTSALPVTFSDVNAPAGTVTITELTSANLTDSNEAGDVVAPTKTTATGFNPATPYSLPPFSVTVFQWQP